MDSSNAKIILREFNLSDEPFVLNSWLKCHCYALPDFDEKDTKERNQCFLDFQDTIYYILKDIGAKIEIACDESDPTWIAGYAVTHEDVLFFAYTRKDYRNHGILNLLIKNKPIEYFTEKTKLGDLVMNKKGFKYSTIGELYESVPRAEQVERQS